MIELNIICRNCGEKETVQLGKAGREAPDRGSEFLRYIGAMADSPDTDSKKKVECINKLVDDWCKGKAHP